MMFFGLMAAAGAGAEEGGGGPPPPVGVADPINPSTYPYGEDLLGLQWTTGESGANTQIGGLTIDSTTEPTSVRDTVGIGVTSYETGLTDDNTCAWWVRHWKDGETSDWVLVVVPGC